MIFSFHRQTYVFIFNREFYKFILRKDRALKGFLCIEQDEEPDQTFMDNGRVIWLKNSRGRRRRLLDDIYPENKASLVRLFNDIINRVPEIESKTVTVIYGNEVPNLEKTLVGGFKRWKFSSVDSFIGCEDNVVIFLDVPLQPENIAR